MAPEYRYRTGQRVTVTIEGGTPQHPRVRTMRGMLIGRRVSAMGEPLYRFRADGAKRTHEVSEREIQPTPPKDTRSFRERLMAAGENLEKRPNNS